jgi:hypothetical protein
LDRVIDWIEVSHFELPKDEDDLLAIIAGLVLGLIGIGILSAILGGGQPKCPNCKTPIQKGTNVCPTCGAWLRW